MWPLRSRSSKNEAGVHPLRRLLSTSARFRGAWDLQGKQATAERTGDQITCEQMFQRSSRRKPTRSGERRTARVNQIDGLVELQIVRMADRLFWVERDDGTL